MPPKSRWPDFRLASSLWFLASSQDGPEKSAADQGVSKEPSNHDDEQHTSPPSDKRDERETESHEAVPAEMDPEEQPIDGVESFDDFGHDAQVDNALDGQEADFGDLEMFDSNATPAPYSSQVHTAFDHGNKAPEAPMDDMSTPSQMRRSKREKKDRKKETEASKSPQPIVKDDTGRKQKRSKRKSALPTEIPDSAPTGRQEASDNTPSNVLPGEEVAATAALTKRKRKSSDAGDGKQRKKKRSHDNAIEASQEVVHGTQDNEVSNAQGSPSDALPQQPEDHAQESSTAPDAYVDSMDIDPHPIAQLAHAAYRDSDNDLGTESRVNGSGTADGAEGRLEMENIAKEALGEAINDEAEGEAQDEAQDEADVYEVPGSPIEAPHPPSSNPKRARAARTKKAKPTYYEEPPSTENDGLFADMPSPSAMSAKKRRAKKATNRRKSEANRALLAQSTEEGNQEYEEGDQARRKDRMAGYIQGRFTDDELNRIARAVESYRSDHDMSQFQVNALIHAPGGTTAGDENKALWARLFATCPDRHRQKIINITRKKFHNFVARGTWTAEQDAELRDLIEVHGTKWSKIAAIINRHPEDLRDRYRNYIVCGDAQRKDAWDETEEGNLTQYVMEAMGAIDELRSMDPSRELLRKPYEELIDWQNISERMKRTRSRLQCITKWKALNIKTHGKDKLASTQPHAQISFRLEKARRQIVDMPDEERYRLVLAIDGSAVSEDAKIPWQRLVDKQYRNSWHRWTQMLLWHRLKQTVPGWEGKTVRDCTSYLLDQYNQVGELPEVSDEKFNDAEEMEFLGTLPAATVSNGTTHNGNHTISEEFVGNSDVENDGQEDVTMAEDGVPDENIQPDLPVEPIVPLEAIQPDLPVEPFELANPTAPTETAEPIKPTEPAEPEQPVEPAESFEPEVVEPAPPKATRAAKKGSGKGRAPRRSAPPKRASRRPPPSQDPIEDDEVFLTQPPAPSAEDNSDIGEGRLRKRKTPNRFQAVNAPEADTRSDYSDSVMDDMEDLPARVPARALGQL